MKVKIHQRTKYWCSGCDANLVAPGQKCKVCGSREVDKKSRRVKKNIPNEETIAVLKECDEGKNLKRYDSIDDLFKDLFNEEEK
jgi:rRNA maturation endonuclease Nob1